MSPKDLSPQTIQVRLVLMRELLETLEKVTASSADDLRADSVTRLAVERIMTQLVDLAVSINQHVVSSLGGLPSADYRSTFGDASKLGLIDTGLARQLASSVGLRNVLVHDYLEVDLQIVADSIPLAKQQYGQYVKAVSRWLREREAA